MYGENTQLGTKKRKEVRKIQDRRKSYEKKKGIVWMLKSGYGLCHIASDRHDEGVGGDGDDRVVIVL